MKQILFSNEAESTLLAGITAIATSCTVQAGDGAEFTQPTASQQFYGKLYNAAGDFEIVYVTARTTDTFTIERAKEGTSALAWNAGDGFCCVATAEALDQMVQRSQLIAGTFTYGAATGTNTYAVTFSPALLENVNNARFSVNIANANTVTAPTIAFNGLAALTIKNFDGSALTIGQLRAGITIEGYIRTADSSFRIISASQKLSIRDYGTVGASTNVYMDDADVILIAASANITLNIISRFGNDRCMLIIKNNNFTVTLVGIHTGTPTLTKAASTQDFVGIVKSFNAVHCISYVLNRITY